MSTQTLGRCTSLFSVLAAVLLSGCSFNHETRKSEAKIDHALTVEDWKSIEPGRAVKLLVGISDDGGYTFRSLLAIDDRTFVQTLFKELASLKPTPAKQYLMIGPKLLVFMGEHGKPLCSFLYWAAGKPNHIFRVCRAKPAGSAFCVEWPGPVTPSLVVPDFGERSKGYFDVWQ